MKKRPIILNNFEDFIINEINFYEFIINIGDNTVLIEASEDDIQYIIENLTQFFSKKSYKIDKRNPEYIIIKFDRNIKLYTDY